MDMDYGGRHTSPGDLDSGRAVVAIHIPARPEYLAVLRAACGQLAPRLGCTRAETADLRLAVDEAGGFLLRNCITPTRGTAQDGLTATFVVEGRSLDITLGIEAEVFVPPDDDEFGWTILTALVDDFAWRADGSAVRVEIRKQCADGRQE